MNGRSTDELEETSLEIPDEWIDFCKQEVKTIAETHENNIGVCVKLKNMIKKSPHLKIRNPIKGECEKIIQNYRKGLNCANDFQRCDSEYNVLFSKEIKLLDEIETAQKSLKRRRLELDDCKDKLKVAKNMYKIQKSALNIAKNVYQSRFDMSVEVQERKDCNTLSAIVHFDPEKENCPVKLNINSLKNKITDLDVSSALFESDEEIVRTELEDLGNTSAVLCALRNKVLKQSK